MYKKNGGGGRKEEWRDRRRKGEKKKRLGKLCEKASSFLPFAEDRVSPGMFWRLAASGLLEKGTFLALHILSLRWGLGFCILMGSVKLLHFSNKGPIEVILQTGDGGAALGGGKPLHAHTRAWSRHLWFRRKSPTIPQSPGSGCPPQPSRMLTDLGIPLWTPGIQAGSLEIPGRGPRGIERRLWSQRRELAEHGELGQGTNWPGEHRKLTGGGEMEILLLALSAHDILKVSGKPATLTQFWCFGSGMGRVK